MAIVLIRKMGCPRSSNPYGITDPKGNPACLRERVERLPMRAKYTKVRARSANDGSGTAGWLLAAPVPACFLKDEEDIAAPPGSLNNRVGVVHGGCVNRELRKHDHSALSQSVRAQSLRGCTTKRRHQPCQLLCFWCERKSDEYRLVKEASGGQKGVAPGGRECSIRLDRNHVAALGTNAHVLSHT